MRIDVLTFGSATLDLFLKTEEISSDGEKVCFSRASKVDLDGIDYHTGGGGSNVATGLSLQGFDVAYCGAVGEDFAGEQVIRELKDFGVETSFIEKVEGSTNLSVILPYKRDRTVFVWREASEMLSSDKWKELDPKWVYLGPLSGGLSDLFGPVVSHFREKGAKIMANPGNSQIKEDPEWLVDILLINEAEASLMTGLSENPFEKLNEMVDGLVVITKGREGAVASDGSSFWSAPSLPAESFKEKTGAGDAFASGFLASILRGKNTEEALQAGIANSSRCISKRGAKRGLIRQGEDWEKVKVTKK